MAKISKRLRRDRGRAFCGAEDLTPSDFYSRADAEETRTDASFVVGRVVTVVP